MKGPKGNRGQTIPGPQGPTGEVSYSKLLHSTILEINAYPLAAVLKNHTEYVSEWKER